MTLDEIAAINQRLDAFEARCARMERILYVVVGVGIGSGALTLSQVIGI